MRQSFVAFFSREQPLPSSERRSRWSKDLLCVYPHSSLGLKIARIACEEKERKRPPKRTVCGTTTEHPATEELRAWKAGATDDITKDDDRQDMMTTMVMMWRRKVRQLVACDAVVEGIFDKVL